MKAKEPPKKLRLSRESIHRLSEPELAAAGGAPPESRPISACATCPSCFSCDRTCTC